MANILKTSLDCKNAFSFVYLLTLLFRGHCFNADAEARDNCSTRGPTTEGVFFPAPTRQLRPTREDQELSDMPANTSEPHTVASVSTSVSRAGDEHQPGAFSQNNRTVPTPTYTLYIEDCVNRTVDIFGYHRVVHGLFRKDDLEVSDETVTCQWTVRVPQGQRVLVKVERLPPCPVSFKKIAILGRGTLCPLDRYYSCNDEMLQLSEENEIQYELIISSLTLPRFRLEFKSVPNDLAQLPVHMTSSVSGYVTQPDHPNRGYYLCRAFYNLVVPQNYVVLVSFEPFTFVCATADRQVAFLELRDLLNNASLLTIKNDCAFNAIGPRVYDSSLSIHYFVRKMVEPLSFRILFSFLHSSLAPTLLPSGLLDCSVSHYTSFKPHVHCNLQQECEGGEDEGGHCPFSSAACNGSVAVRGKCYRLHTDTAGLIPWSTAQERCRAIGENLAMMKTDDEWAAFSKALPSSFFTMDRNERLVHTGLRGFDSTMPNMYQHAYRWVDGTVAYGMGINVPKQGVSLTNAPIVFVGGICTSFSQFSWSLTERMLKAVPCTVPISSNYVCEKQFKVNPAKVSFPTAKDVTRILRTTNQTLTPCPAGHVTHDFLSCDPDSHCGASSYSPTCIVTHADVTSGVTSTWKDVSLTRTFPCGDGSGDKTVHYSLVCDFRNDCPSGSDEAFCVRERTDCEEFRCTNGQCVTWSQRCNTARDCWDGSDEQCGQTHLKDRGQTRRISAPALVRFDGLGNFTQTPMTASDACPDTHFRCSGDGYCLPVYVRCNGVADCPDHEDEAGCRSFSCPGFYRCRASRVCLHADHLCDGWPQCPQHDDELFCQASCPQDCLCQGLAVRCRQVSLHAFPEIRYLDLSASEMTPADVSGHVRLVWLSLARCRLRAVTAMHLPNLRTLDLRDNQLPTANMSMFVSLGNLQELLLAGNPLAHILPEASERIQLSLRSLDLSHTSLSSFGSEVLRNFPRIELINISTTPVVTITEEGFSKTPKLRVLDLKGSPVQVFPGDVFRSLQRLAVVYADNYKMCCKETLPDLRDVQCFAPQDEISSCQDLLRSDLYRTFLWIFSSMSIAGNAGCIIFRLFFMDTKSQRGFNLFVTNLCVSDFLMGVYLTLVGVADSMYRGQYLSYETLWRHSAGCQLAGFLSLLSNEVSAFIICLITLDRFLILRFPFSHVHFKGRSAAVACAVAWTTGFVLATVPFLPVASQWQFYSQTGICIPLPITRKSFKGRNYAFAVMIVINFVLFLSIAVGQAIIFWTIRASSMSRDSTTKKSKDAVIARHLASIVVSDFLCWFPIGLLGVMASVGSPIPSEVNVGMAIFVLPLNSALNPFLYTFNLILEKWEKAEEVRMLRDMQLSVIAESGNSETSGVHR